MTERVSCGDCLGEGVNTEGACDTCGGRGWVIARPARDVLVDEVLPPHSSSILDDLAGNRPALVAWLQEIDLIQPTSFAVEWEPRNITLGNRHPDYRPPRQRVVPVADALDSAVRLWTVKP